MRLAYQIGKNFVVGVKFDTRSHLVGFDLLVGRGEDNDRGRLFTLLVGVPFFALKLSVRTAPIATDLWTLNTKNLRGAA